MLEICNAEDTTDTQLIPKGLFDFLFDLDYIFTPNGSIWFYDDKDSVIEFIENHKLTNSTEWI